MPKAGARKKKQTFCAYTCDAPGMCASRWYYIKALANEDTLLPTQMFPRLPARATFVADTNFVSGHKNVSDFVQKHFVSATNVSQFAQPKKHHEQQCVRNNVSSFASTLRVAGGIKPISIMHYYMAVSHKDLKLPNPRI